jgi:hypothetical protein
MVGDLIENLDGIRNDAEPLVDRRAELANITPEEFFRDLREAGRRGTEQFFAKIDLATMLIGTT